MENISTQRFVSRQFIPWFVLFCTFVAAFFPVLTGLTKTWYQSEDYSHGFAILPLALYILWQKNEYLRNARVCGSWHGLVVATGSLFIYLLANKGEMQTLMSIAMITFLWGVIIYLFGHEIFRIALFPLLIVFLMIPVPSQILAALTIPLQLLVTKASVWLASAIGIPLIHEGNVIIMPEGTFEVVQACSGLRSLMTMMTLGAFLAYQMLRTNLLRGIQFALAIPIAIAINVVRVFILISVFHFLKVDLSQGTLHTVLGLAVFCIAFCLFLLAGKGLSLCEK